MQLNNHIYFSLFYNYKTTFLKFIKNVILFVWNKFNFYLTSKDILIFYLL